MRILLLIDEATLPYLKNGQQPAAPFSHDKNLFQFGQEALRRGFDVFLASAQQNPVSRAYHQVKAIYPEWQYAPDTLGYKDIRPDIIVAVFAEALNIRQFFPHPKIVAIHAALHWVESPERFSAQYLFDLITAVRYNIDFIITQNERMKDLIFVFYNFLAKWSSEERIIVAPLGIVPEEKRQIFSRKDLRKQLGLNDDDVAIVNAGGVWRWTDVNTFLSAFCDVVNKGAHSLKFFMMGLAQATNFDHQEYIEETKAIIKKNEHLIGKNLFIEYDWDVASSKVREVTYCADVGLNVNRNSLENWQSYRLRFLDYMALGIPAINTSGDYISSSVGRDAVFSVEYGNIDSYKATLFDLFYKPHEIEKRRLAMLALAKSFDSRNTYGRAIDTILKMPRRDGDEYTRMQPCVLDYAHDRAVSIMQSKIVDGMNSFITKALQS